MHGSTIKFENVYTRHSYVFLSTIFPYLHAKVFAIYAIKFVLLILYIPQTYHIIQ